MPSPFGENHGREKRPATTLASSLCLCSALFAVDTFLLLFAVLSSGQSPAAACLFSCRGLVPAPFLLSPPAFFLRRSMSSPDVEAATALKVQGNKAFAEHEWPTAIEFYTQAIAKYDREPSFFSNRAQVCCG